MATSTFRQTFNSFSGVDMVVVMAGLIVGEVQGISYTVTREKAPLYTMGSADPRSFSRGKRGIAGSMIFLMFDRSALLHTIGAAPEQSYVANRYEASNVVAEIGAGNGAGQTPHTGATTGSFGTTASGRAITADKVLARPEYADQILPFTVSITAANEYGHVAQMHIAGIEILNMGSGMSVDDITMDESCTFVATQIVPWSNQKFIRDAIVDTSGRSSVGLAGSGR